MRPRFRPTLTALDDRHVPSTVSGSLFLGTPADQPADGLLVVGFTDNTSGLYHGTFDPAQSIWVPNVASPANQQFINSVIPASTSTSPPGSYPSGPGTSIFPPGSTYPPIPPGFFPPSPRADLDRAYNNLSAEANRLAEELDDLGDRIAGLKVDYRTALRNLRDVLRNQPGNAIAIQNASLNYGQATTALTQAVADFNMSVLKYNGVLSELTAVIKKYVSENITVPPVLPTVKTVRTLDAEAIMNDIAGGN